MNVLPVSIYRILSLGRQKYLAPGFNFFLQLRPKSNSSGSNNPFKGQRALLLSKTSRYDYEKLMKPNMNESELKKYLTLKGSDYDGLLEKHCLNQECLIKIKKAIRDFGFELSAVDRSGYTEEEVSKADVIFTAGGDGTFLLAASRILDTKKPVVGFNTDPDRSEGRLCLPHRYGLTPDLALQKFFAGDFKWLWRQRIRVVSSGKNLHDRPDDLQKQMLRFPEHRYVEHVGEHEQLCKPARVYPSQPPRVLPVRALNEVFIGESLSARVSYYEISIDNGTPTKQKSSGVTVCTGTGSTSWYFHINHLSHNSIEQVLSAAQSISPALAAAGRPSEDMIEAIGAAYNSQLCFSPEEQRMAFTVRDPLSNRVFHVTEPRGFAKHIKIRSRMWDGNLVIDGGSVFHFNDGAVATFEILPEDSLMCVEMS